MELNEDNPNSDLKSKRRSRKNDNESLCGTGTEKSRLPGAFNRHRRAM